MKRNSIYIIILFIAPNLFGQLFESEQGKKLFESGTLLIEKGDYKGADSTLTLALCSYKNENVYYNRGVSKLYQKDTLGFCEDMNMAANNYNDISAGKLLNEFCCNKVDTIFYNKKFLPCSQTKYNYYEEIRHFKYDSTIKGIVHCLKVDNFKVNVDFNCEQEFLGVNLRPTDVIGSYELRDTVKYYHQCTEYATIINSDKYKELKKRAEKLFQGVYSNLKKDNDLDELSV